MAAELGHPQGVTSPPGPGSARQAINEMIDAGLLDALMDRVDAGELTLTGQGGFLPEMVKAVLERGLAAELTGHLGYEKGDPAGRGSPNSRNGSTPKTLTFGRLALIAVPTPEEGLTFAQIAQLRKEAVGEEADVRQRHAPSGGERDQEPGWRNWQTRWP